MDLEKANDNARYLRTPVSFYAKLGKCSVDLGLAEFDPEILALVEADRTLYKLGFLREMPEDEVIFRLGIQEENAFFECFADKEIGGLLGDDYQIQTEESRFYAKMYDELLYYCEYTKNLFQHAFKLCWDMTREEYIFLMEFSSSRERMKRILNRAKVVKGDVGMYYVGLIDRIPPDFYECWISECEAEYIEKALYEARAAPETTEFLENIYDTIGVHLSFILEEAEKDK